EVGGHAIYLVIPGWPEGPDPESISQSVPAAQWIPGSMLRIAPDDDSGGIRQAATTSSLTTTNFVSVMRPKLVVSATSAASRPVPIRMRPMRGTLWRASKVYHWPDR